MTLHVKDRLYLQIQINGVTLPLDRLNLLSYLHISESVRTYVPMLSMRLIDATKFLTQNQLLTDGALILVTVGIGDVRRAYEFRLFGTKDVPTGGGTEYSITGYLNAPKYWMESTSKTITGTASSAIQHIANTCNLSFEGVQTSDSQIWLPHNTRYCEFARQVSEHAWLDEHSCLQLALLGRKVLRLVDVSDFESRKPREFFSNQGGYGNLIPVTDYNVLSKAGFFNAASGYKQKKIVQSIVTAADVDLSEINIKRNSHKMSMNRGVKDSVGQSKVTYAPIDVGNVSPTYEKSLYQNRRISNLFNFGAEFVTSKLIESDVLDVVGCDFSKPGVTGIQAISGAFLVTSKVTYIEGMNFYQKCEVYRHGINAQSEKTQV